MPTLKVYQSSSVSAAVLLDTSSSTLTDLSRHETYKVETLSSSCFASDKTDILFFVMINCR